MIGKLYFLLFAYLSLEKLVPLNPLTVLSLQSISHRLKFFQASVSTPEDLRRPDYNSILFGFVWGIVAWDLENGRNGSLVLDDHVSDSFSRTLRDQDDSDVRPRQEATQSCINLLISRVTLDDQEIFHSTIVAFAHAREQQTSDGGGVTNSSDQKCTFASLTLSHFILIITAN